MFPRIASGSLVALCRDYAGPMHSIPGQPLHFFSTPSPAFPVSGTHTHIAFSFWPFPPPLVCLSSLILHPCTISASCFPISQSQLTSQFPSWISEATRLCIAAATCTSGRVRCWADGALAEPSASVGRETRTRQQVRKAGQRNVARRASAWCSVGGKDGLRVGLICVIVALVGTDRCCPEQWNIDRG